MIWIKILIVIIGFFYISGMELSFSPFYIKLPGWITAVGLYLVLIGIALITYDSDRKALLHLREEVEKVVNEVTKDPLKES